MTETRVAYLLLAHRAPGQIARLTDRLCPPGSEDSGDRVILHVDRRADLAPFTAALSAPLQRGQIQLAQRRVRSRWASYALVEASLGLLEQALQDTDCSHFCLLSGDSYPLVAPEILRAFLARAGERSFVFSDDGAQPSRPDRSANARWYWDGDLRRVTYRHYQLGDRQLHLPNRFLPAVPRLAPPADLRLLQGSQWWLLTRDAARHLVEAFIRRPELRRYFRRVQAPDEWAVPMVLHGSPLAGTIVNDDLHFIDWHGWHAATLTAADLPRLAQSPKLFARKLDPDDTALADELDELVSRRAEHPESTVDRLSEALLHA